MITGLLEIAAALRLRHLVAHEWLLALAGMLSIVFGAVVFTWPAAGILALVWWLGAYAIAFGVLLVALGLRLRHHLGHHAGGGGLGASPPLGQTA